MTRGQRIALGYGVSVACLAALVLNVEWAAFAARMRDARWGLIALASPLAAATYVLFALRWRTLLTLHPPPGPVHAFAMLMAGYLANVLLPLRAGDALRVALIRRRHGHGVAQAVSSLVVERMLDVMTVLAIGAVLALVLPLPDRIVGVLRLAGIAVALGLAAAIVVARRPRLLGSVLSVLARPFGARTARALAVQARHFSHALALLVPRSVDGSRRLAWAIALGTAGWALYALAMALCVAAFDVTPAFEAGLLLLVVTNLGAAVPSSPGSIGLYHALGVAALTPFHVGFDTALSIATASHALTVAVQLILGVLSARALHAPLTEVARPVPPAGS